MVKWLGLVLGVLVFLLSCRSEGSAEPDIQVENVWSRPAAMGQMEGTESGQPGQGEMGMGRAMPGTGAAFMTLKNQGKEADRLMGARADVAQVVEVHETILEGDVAKMQQVTGGIELPAGGSVELTPGGYHIMLIGLKRDLKVGDKFPLTLIFETSQELTVEAEVREP